MAGVLALSATVVPSLASASSAPHLPALSAQAVVAKLLSATPANFSGSYKVAPDLGLATLGQALGGSGGLPSVLTGPTVAQVAVGSPGQLRVTVPGALSEQDIFADHGTVWLWSSRRRLATRLVVPSSSPSRPGGSRRASGLQDPALMATRMVTALEPTSRLSVDGTVRVAGQPAYVLSLSPRAPGSLVDVVQVAVDAANGLPLQVSVRARGQATPAVVAGFTSFSGTAPSAGTFAFTPPAGARIRSVSPAVSTRSGWSGAPPATPGTASPAKPAVRVLGSGWNSIAVVPTVTMPASARSLLRSAPVVRGSFGSARLVTTPLADALVLGSGTVLVGAVAPQVLESAAAHVG